MKLLKSVGGIGVDVKNDLDHNFNIFVSIRFFSFFFRFDNIGTYIYVKDKLI